MQLPSITDVTEEARLTARALLDFGSGLLNPTLRLGVTGLSRAGKTVFITALVHNLTKGGRLPVFEAAAEGRIARAHLQPQPDDAVPRFDYEAHLEALTVERRWPESTRRISELRVVIEYQSGRRNPRPRTLTLDIVDYPGEWLLDLPLLQKDYGTWARETLALSHSAARETLARTWLAHLATMDPFGRESESDVRQSAELFTDYLRACRDERFAMSLLPPGRFLMPGDLAGSPALTFAPLDLPEGDAPSGSLWAMMERRYEAYKDVVVRPFFREHFAHLDRQIVLVDALAAINAGADSVRDLQAALAEILACFRSGRASFITSLFRPRIDRVLFAATKADHLHHENHDRLEHILSRMTERAAERAKFAGAQVDVVALAGVRATREATVSHAGEKLPSIVGTPIAGETIGGETFDGEQETAIFPGDLPDDPGPLLAGEEPAAAGAGYHRFVRFRPPKLQRIDSGAMVLPHIRLDRALQFLLGDRLQ